LASSREAPNSCAPVLKWRIAWHSTFALFRRHLVGCTYSILLQIDRIHHAAEFVHPTGYTTSVRVINVDTLRALQISKQPWHDVRPSRDGKHIVFTTSDAKSPLVIHYATDVGKILAQKRLNAAGYTDHDLWVGF
jgi:hypothetical protein